MGMLMRRAEYIKILKEGRIQPKYTFTLSSPTAINSTAYEQLLLGKGAQKQILNTAHFLKQFCCISKKTETQTVVLLA